MKTIEKMNNASAILPEISNHLMINGSMVFFSGLLYGKLGISLFFFHYAWYTGNQLYDEYARYLVDLVKSQLHDDYPLDYERGLAGVGAGFDYLKKHDFFDVGDDLMHQIDLKIIKAVSYESRVDLLIGFGRYLLSRYENNPTMKDSLIQLVDLLVKHSDTTQNINSFSFLCDLCLLGIEKEKIKHYLSGAMDALVNDIQKDTLSEKLFLLIKLSRVSSYCPYRQLVQNTLNSIFSKRKTSIADINELQWMLQCNKLLKEKEYLSVIPKIKNRIVKHLSFYDLSTLDDLFTTNHVFAFQGGYAGLGLVLISISNSESITWSNLLSFL